MSPAIACTSAPPGVCDNNQCVCEMVCLSESVWRCCWIAYWLIVHQLHLQHVCWKRVQPWKLSKKEGGRIIEALESWKSQWIRWCEPYPSHSLVLDAMWASPLARHRFSAMGSGNLAGLSSIFTGNPFPHSSWTFINWSSSSCLHCLEAYWARMGHMRHGHKQSRWLLVLSLRNLALEWGLLCWPGPFSQDASFSKPWTSFHVSFLLFSGNGVKPMVPMIIRDLSGSVGVLGSPHEARVACRGVGKSQQSSLSPRSSKVRSRYFGVIKTMVSITELGRQGRVERRFFHWFGFFRPYFCMPEVHAFCRLRRLQEQTCEQVHSAPWTA